MAVERTRWTDERLDDLAERVMRQDVLEARFDAMERGFGELRTEFREVRAEVREMRRELYDTRRWLITMWLSGLSVMIAILIEIALRS